jgi:hypothetical protein
MRTKMMIAPGVVTLIMIVLAVVSFEGISNRNSAISDLHGTIIVSTIT